METNKNKLGIGFFFLSLGSLVGLITTVVSFLSLLFEALDKKFPDVLNATYQYGYNSYDFDSMRASLATLIIFFPVFLFITYFWKKFYKKGVSALDEIIRNWMIYIILFLSALVVIVDLVTLVRYFIAGEITNRFIYKVLGAILVAVFVGVYYLFELQKREKFWNLSVGLWSIIKSIFFVGLLIWFAFSVMGSPANQRKLRLDERRIQDLQSIQWQVINFYQQKSKLPENLEMLKDPISGYSLPIDPEFEKGILYEYKLISQDDKKAKISPVFELCATFALPIPKGWVEYQNNYGGLMPMVGKDIAVTSYPEYRGGINESWEHEAGRTCFERTIDKELYPPYPKPL